MKLVKSILAAATILSLAGCGSKAIYNAGTYEATAEGRNGDVTVAVTVSDSKIEKVEVKENKETKGIADGALEEVPAAIVKQNKADVDTVSGATLTSNAIITATKDALKKAAK